MSFNFEKAKELMFLGKDVVSLASSTAYKVVDNQLYAEGIPVDNKTYITDEEKQGEWQEIWVVETKEDWDSLTEEQRNMLREEMFESVKTQREFDKKHGRNQK